MQEISKTRIKEMLRRKTSPSLIGAINAARKNAHWLPLAKVLVNSSRKQSSVNLSDIDEKTSAGDTILVPGKILSSGNITKKIKLCSLGISSAAREKLKKSKSEYVSILDEIKSNPKAEGIKTIK